MKLEFEYSHPLSLLLRQNHVMRSQLKIVRHSLTRNWVIIIKRWAHSSDLSAAFSRVGKAAGTCLSFLKCWNEHQLKYKISFILLFVGATGFFILFWSLRILSRKIVRLTGQDWGESWTRPGRNRSGYCQEIQSASPWGINSLSHHPFSLGGLRKNIFKYLFNELSMLTNSPFSHLIY